MSDSARDRIKRAAALRQRRAADPAVSAWVSANAGSGKTRVLTDRVARLLLAKADPAGILCITYTKSAAAEMSGRLFGVLGRWSTASNDKSREALADIGTILPDERMGEARSLFARALETPGGLKIETIHAFCQRVLQRFPAEAGVPPEFEVIDEGEAETLLGEARAQVFHGLNRPENAALAPAIDVLLDGKGEFNFGEILLDGIKNRTKIERFLERFSGQTDLESTLRAQLGLAPDEDRAAVDAAFVADPACSSADLRRLGAALGLGTRPEAKCGATILAFAEANERLSRLQAYRDVWFTDQGTLRKRIANKSTLDANPGLDEIIARETERIEAFETKRRKAKTADESIAALVLLRRIFTHYAALKKARNALDYDDLVVHTLSLLQMHSNAWVHYKLDGGIDHVLIDEAQDTSPDQWEIVRRLTDEFFALEADWATRTRSIFAVGDQKQSIYSFQGADPRRFKLMSDYFGAAVARSGRQWEPAELEISFRSVAEVLRSVDAAFDSDAMRVCLTAEAGTVRHEAARIGEAGLVELWDKEPRPKPDAEDDDWTKPVDTRPESAPERKLARRIAKRIRAWLDEGSPLGASGECARAIEPGDILILVRQRAALFYEMLRALNSEQLPVAGTDRMVMHEEAAFLDLDALGRFCLLPEDDLALAEVLRGPFIGLSDDDLISLAPVRRGSLWRALQTTALPRFARAREWLERALVSARSLRPFEFYHGVLSDEIEPGITARRAFAERLGIDAQEVIAEFLSLALAYEREAPATLQGFLSFAATRADVLKRDMEEAHGRIRVMTVHGAKGLEAPIVFLIDTCSTPQSSRTQWLFGGTDDEIVPLLRAKKQERDPVLDSLVAAEQDRQLREYRRQLYVAMTRARDRLYVAGIESGRQGAYAGSWHETLTEAFGRLGGFRQVQTRDGTVQRLGDEPQGTAQGGASRVAIDLPVWARRRAVHETAMPRRSPSALLADEAAVLPVLAPLTGASDPFLRGRAIHKLLQLLPEMPSGERAPAARRMLSLAPYLSLAEEHGRIVDEVLALLNDSDFSAVFGPGSRAEVAISGVLAAPSGRFTFVSGQIDRLLVTDKEIRIIDFKTNRPVPANASEVPRPYLAQMAAYGRLLQAALPGRKVEAGLLFTAAPRLIGVDIAAIDVTEITGPG